MTKWEKLHKEPTVQASDTTMMSKDKKPGQKNLIT